MPLKVISLCNFTGLTSLVFIGFCFLLVIDMAIAFFLARLFLLKQVKERFQALFLTVSYGISRKENFSQHTKFVNKENKSVDNVTHIRFLTKPSISSILH